MGRHPPVISERLLRALLPRGVVGESILGDLREEYWFREGSHAAWWYRRQALGIAWRGVRDRMRGGGPFSSQAVHRGRRYKRDPMIARLVGAIRYASRGLLRAPQFTIAAVITLALAIGANASIFSVVQGVLLKPLRYHESDRLVMLRHSAPPLGYHRFGMSPGIFFHYRGEARLFESTGIFAMRSVNITGEDAPPDRVTAGVASRDVFRTLAVPPLIGRLFDEAEDQPGGERVVLLSHGFWQERFGGAANAIGQRLSIDGEAHTVIGVMPASFTFPNAETRLWKPLPFDSSANTAYGNFSYEAVARLRDGVTTEQAEATLLPALRQLAELAEGGAFRAFMEKGKLVPLVVPLKEEVVGDISRALWILLGTVGFVFLIACANVTNLFLVRAEARQKEMAVRSALGAGRRGLIGHYLAEAGVIAALGGLVGLVLTAVGLRTLLSTAPPNIPRLGEVSIDPVVLGFTVGVTVLAALLLGLLPTMRLTSPDLLATLSRSGRGSTAGRERHRVRQALVVVQTALALVLLVGSGLMVRSFQKIRALDPGFDASQALTFRISLPSATYPDSARVALFHGQLLERLGGLAGVQAVGASSHAPLAGCCSGTAHDVEDHPTAPGELPPMFWYSTVSAGYFEALGIPIIAGRGFDSSDREPGRRTVIVSERLARRFWPDADPVGKRLRPTSDSSVWYSIVGVAGDVRDQALEREPSEMAYYPVAAGVGEQARNMTYIVRSPRQETLAPLARREVWAVDPNLPIAAMQTYDKIVADSMVRLSFTMLALVVAAAIALFLGAVGLYGVISYIVTQRTNEIGIRLALGARPAQVRGMVVLHGVRLAALGLVIGFTGALALTRLMQGMLFGTEPRDPITFAVVSGVLAMIAGVASYLPAHRASRIDPALSLKAE